MEHNKEFNSVQSAILSFDPIVIVIDVVKRWMLILLAVLIVGVGTFIAVDISYTPVYQTNTTFVVTNRSSNSTVYSNLSSTSSLAAVFTDLLNSSMLRKAVAAETGIGDFEGKNLIIVFGSTSERNLRANLPEVNVLGYKTYKDAYKALKNKQAEGIVADDTILMKYALQDKSVRLLPKRYSQEPYAVAVRKEQESLRLLSKINYIIEDMQNAKKLERLQDKWGIQQ